MDPTPTPKLERQPTALEALLYNLDAAARLLQVEASEIAALTPTPNGCRVQFHHRAWQAIIPRRELLNQFIGDRRARARLLTATQNLDHGSQWTVYDETDDQRHQVTLDTDAVQCTCPDWQEQSAAFGHRQVCCRHCYSVLYQLKFQTLKQYIEAWQPSGRLAKMRALMTRRSRN